MEPLPPAPPPASSIPATTAASAAAAAAVAAANTASYADSLDSSPRSRNTDSWDDPAPTPTLHSKLRLMCSYGGTIVPRPHDKVLCYVGGETRMVVVERHTSLVSLQHRLSLSLLHGQSFTLKYQLPSEDLDSLISVTTDEDLENMIDEYDRTCAATIASSKSPRIRFFLFPVNSEGELPSSQSIGPIINNSAKSEEWFLKALNGGGLHDRGSSDSATVNCLLGLDDEQPVNVDSGARDVEGTGSQKNMNLKQQGNQDVHSVPDSPMLETTSSFGSTSSSPSLTNLQPIRVREEDGSGGERSRVQQDQKVVWIEEQFAQITVNSGGQKLPDEAFVHLSSPPPPMPSALMVSGGLPLSSAAVSGEYQNRVFSDDERSDHGAPIGYRKPPAPQSQPQGLPMQLQQRSSGGHELPSPPDSVSSESSITNPSSRQIPVIYQDPVVQIPSGANRVPANPVEPKVNVSDPNTNTRGQIQQQVQESGYILQPPQFDQQQLQQPQQQFIHAGAHYIHHHPSGAVPIPAYYQVYPSQQQPNLHHHPQIDQQYPVYYVPARSQPPYNLPVQQSSMGEAPTSIPSSHPQNPSNPSMVPPPAAYNPVRNAPMVKSEMSAVTGVYRTTNAGAPQLVQVPASQHQQQYVGYSQIHHPSQSVAPTSAATAAYAYEYADPAHAQIYYAQHLAPTMPSQMKQ